MGGIKEKIYGMSSAAQEVLEKLFLFGPTLDGDIPSKVGRGELFQLGYIEMWEGWSWLNRSGMEYAVNVLLMERRKEKWLRERSEAIHQMRHPRG